MNGTTAPWSAKSIVLWSALAGCALYARHIAASPNWLDVNQRAELAIALIYLALTVGVGLGVCLLQRAYLWLIGFRADASPTTKSGLQALF